MDLKQAISERHSVRIYENRPLGKEIETELNDFISELNGESGLKIQLITGEPKAFDCFMAHYGKFSGVTDYFALVGGKGDAEKCGYYGEKLVLFAQTLGLNTCWTAISYKKQPQALIMAPGDKLFIVIATGYGLTNGTAHRSKDISKLIKSDGAAPEWFSEGAKAAALAPTAINRQKFLLEYHSDGTVSASYSSSLGKKLGRIDLGIIKLHFEIGSGKDSSVWRLK